MYPSIDEEFNFHLDDSNMSIVHCVVQSVKCTMSIHQSYSKSQWKLNPLETIFLQIKMSYIKSTNLKRKRIEIVNIITNEVYIGIVFVNIGRIKAAKSELAPIPKNGHSNWSPIFYVTYIQIRIQIH